MKETSSPFGTRVAARRKEQHLSQKHIADLVGVDPSYLSRIERGWVQPAIGTAAKIAAALRTSLNDLAGASPVETHDRPCPVSADRQCLMDLIDPALEDAAETSDRRYSPREIRVIRSFMRFLGASGPSSLKAMEVLLAGIQPRATLSHRHTG